MQQEKMVVRRVGLGQGWEQPKDAAAPVKPVQVRSGTQITTARIIGGKNQPRAFVWIDEAANDPKREVIICPDMQGSWLWEDGKETTLEVAFPENKEVQLMLRRFHYWLDSLEKFWDISKPQRFFWARFHEEGVVLARKLQALLIQDAVVRYWRPAQDPRGNTEREILL